MELYALAEIKDDFGIGYSFPAFGKGRDNAQIFVLLYKGFIDMPCRADRNLIVDGVRVKACGVPFFAHCDVRALYHIFTADLFLLGAACEKRKAHNKSQQ